MVITTAKEAVAMIPRPFQIFETLAITGLFDPIGGT
jgi:hypothetical protein